KRNRSNENFMKRWYTFKKNCFEVHQGYDAEVYICIRRRGEKYEFKSTGKAPPLSEEEKNESFPLPVQVTAADFARTRSQGSIGSKGQRR
ncbi:hypothetical protein B0J15DRAFT_377572, partial [Fusarium solani]